MPNEQCNTCGSYENLLPCAHCKTTLCTHCQGNHEPYCKQLQKIKAAGGGSTIANMPQDSHRRGHEVPPAGGPDRHTTMPAVLGAPYDLSPAPVKEGTAPAPHDAKTGLWKFAEGVEHLDASVEPVDQGLNAVKDLLGE